MSPMGYKAFLLKPSMDTRLSYPLFATYFPKDRAGVQGCAVVSGGVYHWGGKTGNFIPIRKVFVSNFQQLSELWKIWSWQFVVKLLITVVMYREKKTFPQYAELF